MKEVLERINEKKAVHLEQFKELLRIPSVSADPAFKEEMVRCAAHLRDKLASLGLEVEVYETPGHPIVYAAYERPENRRTLLVYGHYDVQPPDPLDLWTHPPFEPHVEGDRIYARGAADDKGQFLANILGVEAYLEARGSLPVNLKFLIEGEEEVASANLETFVESHLDLLRADGVVLSDGCMYSPDIPALTYGLRGIAAAEIRVRGPGKDLHSGGFGGAVANPATELARIIASLHDADGRVRIEGFYKEVAEIEAWERDLLASLPFDEAEFLQATGSPSLWGEKGYTTLERLGCRPTCEINGLSGGYQGAGGKTIVPAEAGCKVTLRLVPDQDPEVILDRLQAYVKKQACPAIQVEVLRSGGAKPALVSRDSYLVEAALSALEKAFGRAPVFLREGGSIPIVNVFKERLGLDTLLVGYGQHDDNAHSPNEKFSLVDFQRGMVTMAYLMELLQ